MELSEQAQEQTPNETVEFEAEQYDDDYILPSSATVSNNPYPKTRSSTTSV